MKKFICVVAALFMVFAAVSARRIVNAGNRTGVKVVVSQGALTYLKDQSLPVALQSALSSKIDDMHAKVSVPIVGEVDIDLTQIKLNRLNVSSSSISLNAGNQIQVSISGISMDITMHWHYREHPWPHISDSGRGEGATSRSSGVVGVIIGNDNNGRPTAKINQCKLDLSDLGIHLSGGASWLYNAIIDTFHGNIVSSLQHAVCDSLHNDVQKKLDQLLSTAPVQEPVGKYLAIDYSLAVNNGLIIDPAHRIIASSAGEFYPRKGQPGKAPGNPVKMPDSVVDKQFQIFASSFSAQSLGYAAVAAGICEMLITKDKAPTLAKAFFVTDFYETCAPGLVKKYGSGKDIAMYIALHQTPTIEFTQADNIVVKAAVELTIRGQGEKGWEDAFTVLLMTTANAVAKVNNVIISGQLIDASAKASLVSTRVGDIDVSAINDLIDFTLSMSMETVNKILANGTKLPSVEGLSFVDPTILYRDGYIVVATNVHFVPPHF